MLIINRELAERLELSEAKRLAAIATRKAADQPEDRSKVEWIEGSAAICMANYEKGAYTPQNRAQMVGFTDRANEQLDGLEAFYRDLQIPPQLDVSPFVSKEFLSELWSRGYKTRSFTAVYVADLRDLEKRGLLDEPAESRAVIEEVRDEDVPMYARMITEALGRSGGAFFEPFLRFPGATGFFAKVDGDYAGGGAMNVDDGVCGLHLAATLPNFRSNGCQAALTRARLRRGLEAGCDLAMVMTAPGTTSGRNMQRAGFEVAYTRITVGGEVVFP